MIEKLKKGKFLIKVRIKFKKLLIIALLCNIKLKYKLDSKT
jgi:hypothetical protein